MLRKRWVLFISRNKEKLMILLGGIVLLIGISFVATVMISAISRYNLFVSSNENNTNNIILQQQESIIYGDDIEKETYLSDENLIDNFIQYCNNGKIQEAYGLISDDCKKAYYSTQKEFEDLYHKQIFYLKKMCQIQSWITNNSNNTYKVKLITDSFDMGVYDDTSYIEEYYTVVTENEQKKLSINKYIENVELNKTAQNNNINVKVLNKDIYMDYEIYTLEVENLNNIDIKLDSKETTSAMYLLDTNEVRYSSYTHEILEDDLLVKSGENKTIKIKFNKMHNPNIEMSSIEFMDIRMGKSILNMSISLQ